MKHDAPNSRELAAERQWSLSRRHFLRGLGTCVALPSMPSLLSSISRAADAAPAGVTINPGATPLRMAFVTIPNGVNQDHWWPKVTEGGFEFDTTMQPLAALKDQLQVIGGLDHMNATAGPDGAGDHARASATLLTGCRARKTSGANIRVGQSVDQVAAEHLGHLTRFPSLELTCDNVRNSGSCDSGYSCAYQYNVSWRTATTPAPPERNPRAVFERLFGVGNEEERKKHQAIRRMQQRSILDFVREDAKSLSRRLSANDNRKLDEYLTSIRDIEQRVTRIEDLGDLPDVDYQMPDGVPDPFEKRMSVMYDMLVLAFQTDSTRFATMILGHDGSNRPFPEIGIKEAHHELSHHAGKPERLEPLAKIDQHHVKYFAEFLQKLADSKDTDGNSILHNSMIVYTGGNADGNAHSHTNLPVILAGAGGGKLKTGRFHQLNAMPMSNMFLEMLGYLGIQGLDQFGDSNNWRARI